MPYKTFPVAAAATPRRSIAHAQTHLCEVDERGFPVRVLCTRVKIESILDDLTQASDEAPSCPACARKNAFNERAKRRRAEESRP